MEIFVGFFRFAFLALLALFLLEVLRILNSNMESVFPAAGKKANLRLLSGWKILGVSEKHHFIIEDRFTIGRSEESTITIDNSFVSNSHMAIEKIGEEFYIFDLSSKNGTKVNNKLVSSPRGQKLKKGDRISIGDIILEFVPAGEGS